MTSPVRQAKNVTDAERDEAVENIKKADAYADLTAALRAAEPGLHPLADACRAWVTANPHRHRLLFATPLPGYDAHDKRVVTASQQSMDVLLDRIP